MPEPRRPTGIAPRVAILLVNWNRPQDTLECLASLQRVTYTNRFVLLVDNASNDNSVAIIRTQFPGVHITCNAANLGFTGANNVGMQEALRQKADAVLFLNNDTVVSPGFLEPLVATLLAAPNVAIAGPKILFHDPQERIWFAGAVYRHPFGQTLHLHYNEMASQAASEACNSDFISGCALLIRAEVAGELGGFDDQFFCYSEDTDLCLRAAQRGYRSVYVPQSTIWHKVSQSTGGQLGPIAIYYTRRNRLLLFSKHGRWYHWPMFLLHFVFSYVIQTMLELTVSKKPFRCWKALFAALTDFIARRFGRGPAWLEGTGTRRVP